MGLLKSCSTRWLSCQAFESQHARRRLPSRDDHFRQRYREMPLVREGAFKYSANAMYALAFLLFWGIGLLTGSRAVLAAALFQHAYIWVHMYCTEDPDMRVIYGSSSHSAAS